MVKKIVQRELKTIRGNMIIPMADGEVAEQLVFSYESPDRTRGWIVDSAFIWVADPIVSVSGGGNALMIANLATDSYRKNKFNILNPADNRSIGWHSKQYHMQNGTNDFIYPNATPTPDSAFLIDLERIVTNQLFISSGFIPSVSVTQTEINLGYMIVLKQVELSPGQSLLQQLKGIGQDVDN